MACVHSFVDRDMFMRHSGHGIGRQQIGTRQEVEPERGPEGDVDDAEEIDEHEDQINVDVDVDNSDKESEGEGLASESDDDSDDSGDEGCDSDDLGYASF
jgi:hypothetical protein